MARAYAIELRLRVIKAVESGVRISKASELFNVSRDTIYKWKKLKDRQGTLEAVTGYQKGHSHKIKDLESFKEFFKSNTDKTTKELAKQWGNISPATILRQTGVSHLAKLRISQKPSNVVLN